MKKERAREWGHLQLKKASHCCIASLTVSACMRWEQINLTTCLVNNTALSCCMKCHFLLILTVTFGQDIGSIPSQCVLTFGSQPRWNPPKTISKLEMKTPFVAYFIKMNEAYYRWNKSFRCRLLLPSLYFHQKCEWEVVSGVNEMLKDSC